nr:sarcospan isoform X2 [Columba livia]
MWHFEALTICSKCFPCLFSLLDSNTGNSSASTKRSFGGQKNSHSHQRAYTHARENLKFIIMGKKEAKKPQHGTSLNNQSQTGKAPEGEKSTDLSKAQEPAMKKKKKQKKTKGDPKTGQEEESHTCCGCRFPLLFALLQLALGISVTVLGFLMAGISSSLLVRDTPYWAGIIVCVVSLVGFVMLCISYQPDEKTCVQFTVKTGPMPKVSGSRRSLHILARLRSGFAEPSLQRTVGGKGSGSRTAGSLPSLVQVSCHSHIS